MSGVSGGWTGTAMPTGGPAVTGARWRWLWAGIWLVFLSDPAHDIAQRNDVVWTVVGEVGMALFCLVYLLSVPLVVHRRSRTWLWWAVPVAHFALATALLPLTGASGLNLYVFVAVIAVMLLPPRAAFPWVVAEMLVCLAIGRLAHWNSGLSDVFSIGLASAAMFGVVGMIRRNRELAAAHEELARLAVEQERARFARDLHDILGHSLTVITIKSELARRLIERDPERAATELSDIEALSRNALADVRATVRGYREVTLAAEVAAARSALAAAGIAAELPGAVDDIPGNRRELFGWVVREGVTNVVRHSRASRARVSISRTCVEVVDDGRGCARRNGGEAGVGHGLRGLTERVQAAGGRIEAGSLDEGGFRLRVEVPT